jgi:hypothetical protein
MHFIDKSCYVDDILYGGVDSKAFMDRLSIVYQLKDGSVKEPTTYLGADIRRMVVGGDSEYTYAYRMSSDTYLKRAVQEVERELQMAGIQLKAKVVSPSNYSVQVCSNVPTRYTAQILRQSHKDPKCQNIQVLRPVLNRRIFASSELRIRVVPGFC